MSALVLGWHSVHASELQAQSRVATRIDAYIRSYVSGGFFSGAVLVARGDSIILDRAYGGRAQRGAKMGAPTSRFAVASVTKPLTGIIARTLVERGTLRLDDPISKWIPEFPNGSRIQVSQLLGHRSGIPHRVTQPSDEARRQSATTMAAIIGRAPLAFEPGTQRMYSSAGYSLLARVLEAASGKTYAELLREIVLQPSGATQAVDATESEIGRYTLERGHFWTADGPLDAPAKDLSFLVGAGSLWATPHDLFRIARRVAGGAFGATAAGARGEDGSVVWTGFSNGFMAIVSYVPTTDVTVVVLSNLLTGVAESVVENAPRILLGDSVVTPALPRIAAATLAPARRAQLEGTYNYGGNRQQLKFVSPTAALLGGEYMLITTSDSSMYAPQNFIQYTIRRDSSGHVTALSPPGGGPFTISRVPQ